MAAGKKSLLRQIIKLITYHDYQETQPFILKEVEAGQPSGKNAASAQNDSQPAGREKTGRKKAKKAPMPVADYKAKRAAKKEKKSLPCGEEQQELKVAGTLQSNEAIIKDLYCLPDNKDIIVRKIELGVKPPVKAMVVSIQGISDKKLVFESVMQPLMLLSGLSENPPEGNLVDFILEKILPAQEVSKTSNYSEIMDNLQYGSTIIFIDGQTEVLMVDTKGWEHRNIEKPNVEQVVRGPHEAFAEVLRSNVALIRKGLKNNNLITEMHKLGERNRTDCAIMYLNDLANPELVAEVRRRIKSIKVDYLNGSCMLEQMIQDHPLLPTPTILSTERPDRVISYLIEGHVAILVEGSPYALITPATLFSMIHAAEDAYLKWPFGTFLRLVRVVSIFVALLVPGLYVAVVYYHQEMVPTDLLLAIAGARERVPFPALIEILLMEVSFELVREGAIRVPGIIGTTIGIVGALLIGEAAVQANIVSPIIIILVATTGLASFAITNYTLSFTFRLLRFFYIFAAVFAGLFGIGLGLFMQLVVTSHMKSFGVPYLSPIGPKTVHGRDIVFRSPYWMMRRRPDYLNPQDSTRQPKNSRGWAGSNRHGNSGSGQ